jgi:stage IV sporulation protein FB
MRDPFNLSIPLGRLFGVTIRVHILFIILMIIIIARAFARDTSGSGIWFEVLIYLGIVFASILLHEFGHCFGARWVDGDASEVVLWPLGGLAYVDVPPTPKANAISVAAGPAVNLMLVIVAGSILFISGIVPSFNPFHSVFQPELSSRVDDQVYGYRHNPYRFFRDVPVGDGVTRAVGVPLDYVMVATDTGRFYARDGHKLEPARPAELAQMHWTQYFLWMAFSINLILLLLNLLPGFPLDGGRLLHAYLWARRGDSRSALQVAIVTGYFTGGGIILLAVFSGEPLLAMLGIFVILTCYQHSQQLQIAGEEMVFGYDFSQGYTSLEKAEQKAMRPRRPNFFQRWLQRRAARRLQREEEQRRAEEQRMDELLDKVHRYGQSSLTEEERRFMARVSERYRKRS